MPHLRVVTEMCSSSIIMSSIAVVYGLADLELSLVSVPKIDSSNLILLDTQKVNAYMIREA